MEFQLRTKQLSTHNL